ncbi:hypothetical protein FH972_010316 [Carpinus fangiana]|uniref:Glabrous enhancer-binding protein-like DBD domain-containing protein n=1 Tax=Carpinus fangiana TaxID=176857 RepID=A0A660KMZ4_9ROSI|nr:hypothetical protein FH972_010316 [Carpinus fangiana]
MEDKVDGRSGEGAENHNLIIDKKIGLLNAIIDYYATNGMYPFHDHIPLHYFITDWLQVDIPEEKLIDLVKMLRKKYLSNMARKGTTTVDFADSYDQIAFNLAHKIWGGGSNEEYWKGLKLKVKGVNQFVLGSSSGQEERRVENQELMRSSISLNRCLSLAKNKWEKALVSARSRYFGNGHLSAKNKWEKPMGISVGCLCLAKNKRRNGL